MTSEILGKVPVCKNKRAVRPYSDNYIDALLRVYELGFGKLSDYCSWAGRTKLRRLVV